MSNLKEWNDLKSDQNCSGEESPGSHIEVNERRYAATPDNSQQSVPPSAEQWMTFEAEKKSLEGKIKNCAAELDFYAAHYSAAVNERNEYLGLYTRVINSKSWKATKPFRVVGTFIKKVLRRIPGLKHIYTFLSVSRSIGLRGALSRVKIRLFGFPNRIDARNPAELHKELQRQRETKFDRDTKISIIVPLFNPPETLLKEMVDSVIGQTYSNWELCLADASDKEHHYVETICKSIAEKDKRIIYKKLDRNRGISENTNKGVELATGEYLGLLDHDDLLHPSALFEVMVAISEKSADMVYTDETTFTKTPADAYNTHCKPDYAPDTLRSYNYICHFCVFSTELFREAGPFNSAFDGSQDYDMILRLTERARNIVHVPKVLYYWRAHDGSVASNIDVKPYTVSAARCALAAHLDRMGLQGHVEDTRERSIYKINYDIIGEPLVSILIPNMDHAGTLSECINSIILNSTYKNFEIIVIENNSKQPETFDYYEEIAAHPKINIVYWGKGFNYSEINNFGAKHAKGDYLLLLNNDITVITPDWIEEMLMFAQRADVGAVGAKLYYPDDTVQHAGTIIGIGGVAGHAHVGFKRNAKGYMFRLIPAQNLSAVTAACMMLRKAVFCEIEGLDPMFKVAFNDVDLCMRLRDRGYLIVFTPFAELYHYESKSRGYEDTPEKIKRFNSESDLFKTRWSKELLRGDPYYNPNLTLKRNDFSFKRPEE